MYVLDSQRLSEGWYNFDVAEIVESLDKTKGKNVLFSFQANINGPMHTKIKRMMDLANEMSEIEDKLGEQVECEEESDEQCKPLTEERLSRLEQNVEALLSPDSDINYGSYVDTTLVKERIGSAVSIIRDLVHAQMNANVQLSPESSARKVFDSACAFLQRQFDEDIPRTVQEYPQADFTPILGQDVEVDLEAMRRKMEGTIPETCSSKCVLGEGGPKRCCLKKGHQGIHTNPDGYWWNNEGEDKV